MPKVINEGDYVMLRRDKSLKVVLVKSARPVFVDKIQFTLDEIIGQPYGSKFALKNGKMVKVDGKQMDCIDLQEYGKGIDNRNLVGRDSNQKLSHDEIQSMKKSGVDGESIVERLIENSSTFQDKTEFSQQKYVKKKKTKHTMMSTVLFPTTRLLAEMYFNKSPARICYLRQDTLGQILTYGDIRAGINVAVMETCLGLVVGAVMEKMGGHGKIIHIYQDHVPSRPAVDYYSFDEQHLNSLYGFPLNQLNSLGCTEHMTKDIVTAAGKLESLEDSIDNKIGVKQEMENESHHISELGGKVALSERKEDDTDLQLGDSILESSVTPGKRKLKSWDITKEKRREQQARKITEARGLLVDKKLDCLIVACKFHPTPIVLSLVDCVAPSRPIIVYSQYKEPLIDCYAQMREAGGAVNFRLSETWLREYQVLPERTHPLVNMSGTGGYLLLATTVIKS